MASLQVKNLPEGLHERLRRYARKKHRTISDVATEALEREMARFEWQEKLAQRPETDLESTAASLLEEVRRDRERELG